jgi:hypothetical protein
MERSATPGIEGLCGECRVAELGVRLAVNVSPLRGFDMRARPTEGSATLHLRLFKLRRSAARLAFGGD